MRVTRVSLLGVIVACACLAWTGCSESDPGDDDVREAAPSQGAPELSVGEAGAHLIQGTVYWPDGSPAAAVMIRIEEGKEHLETETGKDGSFRATVSDREPRYLVAEPQGIVDAGKLMQTRVSPTNAAPVLLQGVRPGSAPIEIHLKPGLEIDGRVSGLNGAGVPEAMIHAVSVPGAKGHLAIAVAATDLSGRFKLRGLVKREYWIEVIAIPSGTRAYTGKVKPGSSDLHILLEE